jgi:methionyl-tRNA synthetase
LLDHVDGALTEAAAQFEKVELRGALRAGMAAASQANVYLNETAPWSTAKTDLIRTATTLHTALSAINGIKTILAPFLPFTSQRLHEMLGQDGMLAEGPWERGSLEPGTPLGEQAPLFSKVDPEILEE